MSVDSTSQKLAGSGGKAQRDIEASRDLKSVTALSDNCEMLSVLLALALIAGRISRASGEENQLGYRHEYYREDGDRITVNTDSVLFDVGLNSHVRLVGTFVNDAISGATPTGAPPQSQWPYATFNSLYKTAYNQAYTSVYDQFVAANQIFVDQGYETYQQMTNQAGVVAQSVAPGIATNSATATYQGITNNPNYKNNSVPLTHMHDHRQAFSIGVPFSWGVQELRPLFSYSEESDYISYGGALTYSLALNQKNTTLTFGYSHNSDSVRDENFIWESKSSDDFLVGVSQLLNPKSYMTFNFTFGNETGYLADPYRSVMVVGNPDFLQTNPDDAALFPEKRPRNRTKETAYLSYTRFIDPLNGSLETSYRFFHDSWDIYSHTFTVVWNQKLGKQIVLSPSFRYSVQTAADFYYVLVPAYTGLPPYYSSDYRLSHFESFAYGLNFTYRISRFLSLDASYLRYVMHGLDGVTSQTAYPSANVGSLGLRIWF
jgi:hypothetical protein